MNRQEMEPMQVEQNNGFRNSLTIGNNHQQSGNCRHPGFDARSQIRQNHCEGNIFQCNTPATPNMQQEEIRRNTFSNESWPSNLVGLIASLTRAGFYYLGERDRTKCFYCNGGLQNWEDCQDPWVEHSKWYPDCDHLLANKGLDFVDQVANKFPNLKRPSYNHRRSGNELPSSSSSQREKTLQEKIEEFMASQLVKEVEPFGFSKQLIRKVVEAKLGKGESYRSVSEIVNEVIDAENNQVNNYVNEIHEHPSMPVNNMEPNHVESDAVLNSIAQLNNEQQKQRLQDLQDEQRCKICLDEETNCLFLPCNHLCCCENCAKSLRSCPLCRVKLTQIIKIYRT